MHILMNILKVINNKYLYYDCKNSLHSHQIIYNNVIISAF